MKKRIQELAAQAGIDDALVPVDVMEKFAMLIVDECLEEIDDVIIDRISQIVNKSKEDVGVKE